MLSLLLCVQLHLCVATHPIQHFLTFCEVHSQNPNCIHSAIQGEELTLSLTAMTPN